VTLSPQRHNESVRQLALGVHLSTGRRLDNFINTENKHALDMIQHVLVTEDTPYLYLQGPSGSGKSHLLQGACAEAAAQGRQVSYIPLRERGTFDVRLLSSLADCDLVCIDDIDVIATNSEWQRAVFNFYNEAYGNVTQVLFSARQEPACIALADLSSRLNAALRVTLKPATDQLKAQVLEQRARGFGFDLKEDVLQYILQHYSRDMHDLMHLIEALDRYALAAKQRVSLGLVRKFLRQEQTTEQP